MKKQWIAFGVALALAMTLTGCRSNTTNDAGTQGSAGNANGSVSGPTTGSQDEWSGSGGSSGSGSMDGSGSGSGNMSGSSAGAGSGSMTGSGSGVMNGSASGSANRTSRSVNDGYKATRRTAYDYLHDGRYAADEDGEVNGRWDPAARDFTQGARDLLRDAGAAVGDAGRAVGDAVDGVGNGLRNAAGGTMHF